MAAHILSGSTPNTEHALRLVSHWHKKAPMLMQQMLMMRLGVPTLTPTGATQCNCRPNGKYGGVRRFDRATDCNKDEDFACGVPLHRILCQRRQQRIVARHDAVAQVLPTRLRSLPGLTVVEGPPARREALPGAGADLKVELKARKWLTDTAIVCPATKSVVARQNMHVHHGVSAKL